MIMYIDYFNGITNKDSELLRSKTIRLFTTDGTNEFWLASAPWKEDLKIEISHSFQALGENANWAEILSSSIGTGRDKFNQLENSLYSIINKGSDFATNILKKLGIGDSKIAEWIEKAKEWSAKNQGDTAIGTYKRYYSQDILKQFNGSEINNGRPLVSNMEFFIISTDHLKSVMQSLPKIAKRTFPGADDTTKPDNTVINNNYDKQPVKQYIDYLINMIGPQISITEKTAGLERGMIALAPNGYKRPTERDFGRKIQGTLYAIAGENLYIENLLPTSLSIDIPSMRTPDGDFLYARINIGLIEAQKVTTAELKSWIRGSEKRSIGDLVR